MLSGGNWGGGKPQEVKSWQAPCPWRAPSVAIPVPCAGAATLGVPRPARLTADTSDGTNWKSKAKRIPDLRRQIAHLQGKPVRNWPLALPSPTHATAASWNPRRLAAEAALTQTLGHTSVAGAQRVRGKLQGLSSHPHPTLARSQAEIWSFPGAKLHLKGAQLQRELRLCQVLGVPLWTTPLLPKSRCQEITLSFRIDFFLLQLSKLGYCYIFFSNVRIFHNKTDIFFL